MMCLIPFGVYAGSPTSGLLSGYHLPVNKQGLADRNYDLLEEKRYTVFQKEMAFGIQKYNYYWRDVEDMLPSSSKPQVCTKGYTLFPINDKQKQLLGIHNYHCYKKGLLRRWEKRFAQNTNYDIQVAVVLWTTPKMYTDQGCEGFYFPLQQRYLKGGCYPIAEHYDDYEDWIRFTAFRFGRHIDHYIVWNEAEMLNWADTSTRTYPKKIIFNDFQFHMDRSFSIYTNLLKKTIAAVTALDKRCMNVEGVCKNLIYVSLTGDWYSRKVHAHTTKKGEISIKWRNMNLLDHIWKELGLDYDWSIAIHPYGRVYSKNKQALRFSTLKDLSQYQKKQIDVRKEKKREWLSYPQSRLFASEQNVGGKVKADDWKQKAKFICESYDVAFTMPELIAMTHNHFQDNIHRKNTKPTRHTMLPATVKEDLSDAKNYETFRAYQSTSTDVWNKKDDHYCCNLYSLGCNTKSE